MSHLVSIIIPVKDRIDWFQETLESVFSQSYPNIEVIIVDDGSAPSVQSLLPGLLEKPNVVILRNETSQGVGAAREIGRLAAKGSFINYLDSDDVLHPRMIQESVNALRESPDAGMCYCTCVRFRELPITGKEPVWKSSDQINPHINLIDLVFARPWGTGACL